MNILICSQIGEFQVESVSDFLRNLGANPVLFERYRKDHLISYHYTNNCVNACLNIEEKEYPLTSEIFPVVWYRPKPILLSEIPGEIAKIQEKFCMQEWKVILQSLDIFLNKSRWVNPLRSNLRAANKAYQLKSAIDTGLRIPKTIITNDAREALELFENQRVIYKTLSSFFTAKQAIYTNEITEQQVSNSYNEIAMAPGIFQQCCEKNHELRVTVIGEKIYTVKINSQQKSSTQIDWRRSPDSEIYQVGELSPEMSEKLLMLHKKLGLVYAAYDFIVDDKGHEIFLECNPSGQWLWLEQATGANISLAMAKELIS